MSLEPRENLRGSFLLAAKEEFFHLLSVGNGANDEHFLGISLSFSLYHNIESMQYCGLIM